MWQVKFCEQRPTWNMNIPDPEYHSSMSRKITKVYLRVEFSGADCFFGLLVQFYFANKTNSKSESILPHKISIISKIYISIFSLCLRVAMTKFELILHKLSARELWRWKQFLSIYLIVGKNRIPERKYAMRIFSRFRSRLVQHHEFLSVTFSPLNIRVGKCTRRYILSACTHDLFIWIPKQHLNAEDFQ